MKIEKVNLNLYKICFSFNPYNQMWSACESEHLDDLWNGVENNKIIYAKDKETLISYFNEGKHLIKDGNPDDDVYYLKGKE